MDGPNKITPSYWADAGYQHRPPHAEPEALRQAKQAVRRHIAKAWAYSPEMAGSANRKSVTSLGLHFGCNQIEGVIPILTAGTDGAKYSEHCREIE